MHFSRCGHAEITTLFSIVPPYLGNPEAERAPKLSSERACLPCGPGFPQTLLDM
jgi:hypothetical protein